MRIHFPDKGEKIGHFFGAQVIVLNFLEPEDADFIVRPRREKHAIDEIAKAGDHGRLVVAGGAKPWVTLVVVRRVGQVPIRIDDHFVGVMKLGQKPAIFAVDAIAGYGVQETLKQGRT